MILRVFKCPNFQLPTHQVLPGLHWSRNCRPSLCHSYIWNITRGRRRDRGGFIRFRRIGKFWPNMNTKPGLGIVRIIVIRMWNCQICGDDATRGRTTSQWATRNYLESKRLLTGWGGHTYIYIYIYILRSLGFISISPTKTNVNMTHRFTTYLSGKLPSNNEITESDQSEFFL